MSAPLSRSNVPAVEYLIERYFNERVVPVMDSERKALQEAQSRQTKSFGENVGEFIRSMAMASNPAAVDDTVTYLRATGTGACAKTEEDYVCSVQSSLASDPAISNDFSALADQWRAAVIADVGQERYEAISQRLGADLAVVYVNQRLDDLMLNRMVKEKMPQSSMDYIIRKGAGDSIFGLGQSSLQSPLEKEIARLGNEAYNPTGGEKLAARGVSFVSDIAAMGGASSWGQLGGYAAMECVGAGVEKQFASDQPTQQGLTMEQAVGQALYGSQTAITSFRKQAQGIQAYNSTEVQGINAGLSKPLPNLGAAPAIAGATALEETMRSGVKPLSEVFPTEDPIVASVKARAASKASEDKKVEQNDQTTMSNPKEEGRVATATQEEVMTTVDADTTQSSKEVAQEGTSQSKKEIAQDDAPQKELVQEQPTNENGWGGLLSSVGLGSLGDIGSNLGYVLAMLPDVLLGAWRGTNSNLTFGKSLMPLASIVAGCFIKNPIMKMLLLGMGGLNLFNKAGEDALGKTASGKYRRYDDEPLNPRITNPAINGSLLVANIDNVPCSISLPATAVEAYNEGSLPLNTLANAVLAQHERNQDATRLAYNNLDQQRSAQAMQLK
ncbi:MAG: hypothetical protein LUC85_03140 [Bacteroidales bacterium]|nr:hypothetical protein [Bacteroidales bacterium]